MVLLFNAQWHDDAEWQHGRNGHHLLLVAVLAVLLALTLVLFWTMPVQAQSDANWQASYWNSVDMSGAPVLARLEAELNHDWGTGSPAPVVNTDRFSARWERTIDEAAGDYRFTAVSDDGIRVYVDGELLIDRWTDHAAQVDEADKYLSSGRHLVRVDYYENRELAVARLSWRLVSGGVISEWRGEYFNNRDLSGTPVLVRNDSHIDFDWGTGSPAPGVGSDRFSVRWTRWLNFGAGRYRFTTRVDDGVRLWVNNQLIIDRWHDQAATEHSGEIYLSGGVPVRMEVYENEGSAVARLGWWRIDEVFRQGEVGEWRAEFFDNRDLSGSPDHVRYDYAIDYDWGGGSPAPGIDEDNFSVRWTRVAYFKGGRYRFDVTCDDGVRLYVDGKRIMDEWHDMSATRMTKEVTLSEGKHTICLEYYEHHGAAVADLHWDQTDEREPQRVGNIITCAPPQPDNNAWVKIYRRTDSGDWENMTPKGIGAIDATGFLKIDGLPVDVDRYGDQGHPYCIEVFLDGALINSCGNTDHGESEFRVFPNVDNYTPWQCPRPG